MTEFSLQCTRHNRTQMDIIMKKSLIALLGTTLLTTLIASCSTSTDPADAYKGQTQQQIYKEGKVALQNSSYSDAVKHFEALDVQYPYGADTETAQMYLIYAYYMKEDYALAIAEADHFIRLHPSNPHIDYAYYRRGMSNFYQNLGPLEKLFNVDKATRDLTQIQKSYNDFRLVSLQYPHSVYAGASYQYMIYLRNILADYELHIGEYYYERGAYVASANRSASLVSHYQGSPQVLDGLVMMVKSYHNLGLTKLENDTLRVLNYNYKDVKIDYNAERAVALK